MSLLQDMTYITLWGTKESVVRMLNAVIRNVGNGDIITDSDDLETINNKIKDEKDGYGFRISIPDLLEDKCMEDSLLLGKKVAYEESKNNGETNYEDEDDDEGYEDDLSTDERMIDISIEESAFSGCKSLKEIEIPGNVKDIGNHAFDWCQGLERVKIGDGVQVIGFSAFSSCKALKEISIPDSVTKIYGNAFRNCSSLEHVTISGNIRKVGPSCFRECTALTGIVIPEGVIKIDDGAFAGCTSLTDIVIPESLTEIEEHAFDDCPCVEMLASRYPNLKKESVEAKNSQEEKKASDEGPLDLPF